MSTSKKSRIRKNWGVVMTILILLFLVIIPVFQIHGADYQLLEGLPGINTENLTLSSYLQGMFRIGLGIAIILAVLMLVVGGIKYMATGSLSEKSDAKDIIKNAIFGLLLALISVLILQTINPDLLNFNLEKTIENVPGQTEATD